MKEQNWPASKKQLRSLAWIVVKVERHDPLIRTRIDDRALGAD
jgi:hypothetical protein